jgi:nucleoside-diphosphate-sugar epimerase
MAGRTILVTGATGKQGNAVIDALVALNEPNLTILAVTRNPSAAARKLLSKSSTDSIKLVTGDLDDVPAIFEEAKKVAPSQPIWGVFSVLVSMGKNVTLESEVRQGKDLIDGAIKNGVKCFVYSSVDRGGDEASWDEPTPIVHFQSKLVIEKYLREVTMHGREGSEMGWTILRPVAFMENLGPTFDTRVFLAAMQNWMGEKPMRMFRPLAPLLGWWERERYGLTMS